MTFDLIDLVGDALTEAIPDLVGTALADAAKKTKDPLLKATVGIVAKFARENTGEAVTVLADELSDFIRGRTNPVAVMGMGLSARELSDLTDALQDAESAHRVKVSRDLQKFGTQLGVWLKILGVAAVKAAI